MKKPLFSCVIPVKGERPFFDEALASLKSQGMGDDLEIIVQDADVRSGGLGELGVGELNHEIHERHENGRAVSAQRLAVSDGGLEGVRWFREADKGQSDALNKGFAKARGEWLFWLNADDVLLPGALKNLTQRLRGTEGCGDACGASGVEWIAGNMVTIDADGRVLRCLRDRGKWQEYAGRPIRVFGPSSFFRRELFERVGGLDVSLRYCMDTDLWCKFREAGVWFEKIGGYVWGFREHSGSITTGKKAPGEQARQDAEVAAMHRRHGVKMTRNDVWAMRFRRLLDGSFIGAAFDTLRFKGKDWRRVFK